MARSPFYDHPTNLPTPRPQNTQHKNQVRDDLVRQRFDADPDKPLPPVRVDKGSGVLRDVPVGEVLAEVAGVLGGDMARWKAMIAESLRRREQREARALGGGRGDGGGVPGRYGPRPVLAPAGLGVMPLAAAAAAGVEGDLVGGAARRNKPYKDIDVPKVSLLWLVGRGVVCVCVRMSVPVYIDSFFW